MMHWDDTFDRDHARQLAISICACNAKWKYELDDINLDELRRAWDQEVYSICQQMLAVMSAEVNEYRRIAQEAINRYPGPLSDLTGKQIRHKDGDPLNNGELYT
jgi:hypothetical protein